MKYGGIVRHYIIGRHYIIVRHYIIGGGMRSLGASAPQNYELLIRILFFTTELCLTSLLCPALLNKLISHHTLYFTTNLMSGHNYPNKCLIFSSKPIHRLVELLGKISRTASTVHIVD